MVIDFAMKVWMLIGDCDGPNTQSGYPRVCQNGGPATQNYNEKSLEMSRII
jgi:hypothetical protein